MKKMKRTRRNNFDNIVPVDDFSFLVVVGRLAMSKIGFGLCPIPISMIGFYLISTTRHVKVQ